MGGGTVAGVIGAGVTGLDVPGITSHDCGYPKPLPQVGQDGAGGAFQVVVPGKYPGLKPQGSLHGS